MPTVRFTRHLERFFPGLRPLSVSGATVAEAIASLDGAHPGLRAYLLDEHGRMRKHVNIFVDGRLIADRDRLSDPVRPTSDLCIMQALSGG